MKKIASKKLQLSKIKIASLSQPQQVEVKGGASSLCTRYISCGQPPSCIC
ncbi:class I lanthipeptide [Chitinophaga nivalis]|uniref:Class I lanthipeptide n=1 Tax=Chitinophaga nivalis TaxID=2991709 RepID=A0ABT3IKI6_9BACT|nr:class I lanthipeptide [Chitinophaga nivalis]MCW3465843.1 class I lanthipeptide [Chitinophaga nivalis]MCW3484466.1 class I lanthipeptide [Chitinophaga nivalis]